MRRPQAAGVVARELSERISSPLAQDHWDGGAAVRRAASLLDIGLAVSPGPAEVNLPALLQVMEEAKKKTEEALGNLTEEEKILLRKAANDTADESQWNRILEISMSVDRPRLFDAFSPLLAFMTRDNLALLKKDLVSRFASGKGLLLYEVMTPIGKVLVGGEGQNVYAEDAALILDLGGDDIYLSNAGGARPGMPVALVIDFSGNDHYLGREHFSQGAGLLGGGFLVDLGGEGRTGIRGGDLVQGAATNGGVGILIDPRGGPDKRSFQSSGQAFTAEDNALGIMIHRGQGSGVVVELGIKKE